MNILVVSPSFYPDKAIGAVRMTSLARFLVKAGFGVTVLTNKKDTEECITGVCREDVEVELSGSYFKRFKENQKRYCDAFRSACEKNSFDAVVVSGGPFFTFETAVEAKKMNIPCILDFRDPWFFDYRGFKQFFSLKRFMGALWELPMERRAVKAADKVVTVTPGWVKAFKWFYPMQKNKFNLIENGYDDELLSGMELCGKEKSEKLTIGVFGKAFYYTDKYSDVFLGGVKGYEDGVRLLQIGTREGSADAILERNGVNKDFLESTGFVDYKEGMEILKSADAFLIIDIRKSAIGTKIYDYIYLDKPIIYTGPKKTVIADMVSAFPGGYVCETDDEVRAAVEDLISRRGASLGAEKNTEQYSRSGKNRQWELLIKDTAEK